MLFRAILGLHSTFTDEIWLWRGQADGRYGLEPAIHSRVRNTAGLSFDEANASWATQQLIEIARSNGLDHIGDFRLPDLALLAHLQHHGAATPLLDVSVDPLVGLWMATHASGTSVEASDSENALLFAIRRPSESKWLESLDSRDYVDDKASDVASTLADGAIYWFRPPDVSERLRIQRGSFLLGALANPASSPTSLALTYSAETWLAGRIERLGKPGQPRKARTEIAVFEIRAALKPQIRTWLSQRAGLDVATVYPTAWNRPFLDQFCAAYGRSRPIDH
jgi:hypothetical protein